jgi:hypothetical protein
MHRQVRGYDGQPASHGFDKRMGEGFGISGSNVKITGAEYVL